MDYLITLSQSADLAASELLLIGLEVVLHNVEDDLKMSSQRAGACLSAYRNADPYDGIHSVACEVRCKTIRGP